MEFPKLKVMCPKPEKVLAIVLCLLSGSVFAQEFEGTVRWTVTLQYSDPADQARMEAALKKQQQTALQEEAKKKLPEGTPKNENAVEGPQSKVQPRKESGPTLQKIPTFMLIHFQDGNSLTVMDGPGDREFLYVGKRDAVYSLNKEKKTYRLLHRKDKKESNDSKRPTIEPPWEKTTEIASILDYECVKYSKSYVERGNAVTREVWLTEDLKKPDMTMLSKYPVGRHIWSLENLKGVPMRLVSSDPEVTVTFQVSEIKKKNLDKNLFSIPSGFKENR